MERLGSDVGNKTKKKNGSFSRRKGKIKLDGWVGTGAGVGPLLALILPQLLSTEERRERGQHQRGVFSLWQQIDF